jgi:hypothetical protein
METAGRRRPVLDQDTGWRDANHNFARDGGERQCACEDQSDHSFTKHNKLSFS